PRRDAPASQQTPPPGRRPDSLHLQRDPPTTGNDPSRPRSRDHLPPPLVSLATTPPSPRRAVPLPATRRTTRPPQPPLDQQGQQARSTQCAAVIPVRLVSSTSEA